MQDDQHLVSWVSAHRVTVCHEQSVEHPHLLSTADRHPVDVLIAGTSVHRNKDWVKPAFVGSSPTSVNKQTNDLRRQKKHHRF